MHEKNGSLVENEMVINLGGQNYGTPNCRNTDFVW